MTRIWQKQQIMSIVSFWETIVNQVDGPQWTDHNHFEQGTSFIINLQSINYDNFWRHQK